LSFAALTYLRATRPALQPFSLINCSRFGGGGGHSPGLRAIILHCALRFKGTVFLGGHRVILPAN